MIITMICLCILCLYIGITLPFIFKKREKSNSHKPKSNHKKPKPNKKKFKGIRTMDLILIIIGALLIIFTVYMIILFREYGMIPDTLVTCVFATLAGECGIMGWIKTTKDRRQDRKWELEDRAEFNECDSSEDNEYEMETEEENSENEGG